MKILYVTTISGTMILFDKLIAELIKKGHSVDFAANTEMSFIPQSLQELGCKCYEIKSSRSPFKKDNLLAIRQLKQIIKKNDYDIVHCHTPIASICTRLACVKYRKKGLKVFYTAHGFHFYKTAPLINWLIYYPLEKLCSYFTDVLITINHEDYNLAVKKMKAKRIEYVPGVGIDVKDLENIIVDKKKKRAEIGVPYDAFVVSSVGELNANKNHEVIIRAIAKLNNDKIHYVVSGVGELELYLKKLVKQLNLHNKVHFLGFRNDVKEIYKVSDVCCFPSIREGLGLAALEAMAIGIPIIASENRGTKEYIIENKNGFLCEYSDIDSFSLFIKRLLENKELGEKLVEGGKETINKFDISTVNDIMEKIYNEYKR